MNTLYCIIFVLALASASRAQTNATTAAIPQGKIRGPFPWKSAIYPGTEREYWIYVPEQYDPAKPACTMIVQDGLSRATGWNLPAVMDSLIHLGQIPVTIGIFIDHGRVPATGNHLGRYNRSFEYDALGDRHARFLLEEILPEVAREYNLSTNPDDRCIAGASSGAICAFNTAWERPDAFRRVLSTIGTYVGLRGGDVFTTLVRKTEPKPLRVFLEDGSNDLDIYAGGWWTANQSMLAALTWAGYEVNHSWGDGGHNSEHARQILPEALVWLWKDYPSGVKTHPNSARRMDLALAGEDWREIPLGDAKASQLAIDHTGQVFFASGSMVYSFGANGRVIRVGDAKGTIGGISFHRNGKMYLGDLSGKKIIAAEGEERFRDVVTGVIADHITITGKGIYFSDTDDERVGFFSFASGNVTYAMLPGGPTGLSVSAEQTFLSVGVKDRVLGYSFRINDDGSLNFGQEYHHYHVPHGSGTAGVRGMTTDTEDRLYAATAMGVQVFDPLGRVNFIFSRPVNVGFDDIKFGGSGFDTMYITGEGRLFARKVKAKGTLAWGHPAKPPKPGL